MNFHVVKVTYRHRVTEQAYICNMPLFKPWLINVWGPELVAYFDDMATYLDRFSSWRKQKPWEFDVLDINKVRSPVDIPKNVLVYSPGQSYWINKDRVYKKITAMHRIEIGLLEAYHP